MNNQLLSGVLETARRLKGLILVIGLLYVACIGGGVVTGRVMPEKLRTTIAERNAQSAQGVEKIFGRFREPVREGHWGTIAACSGLVFLINLLGDFVQFTILSILIVPACFTLGLGGWMQGIGLAGVHASSGLSLSLFLLMGGLEWITYVLATVAGVNIGLSFLMPKRQAAETRWLAFKRAWGDAGRIYLLIAGILAVQAVFEMLYVRKVLLMGGSGVPLMPY
jgi:hypothetical protein